MALTTHRHGALYVVGDSPDEHYRKEIKRIDPRLFLERQVTLANEVVWCVVLDAGLPEGPVTVLEWRGRGGRPVDLSSGLLDELRRMKQQLGRGDDAFVAVAQANQRLIERRRLESRAAYEDIVADMLPRMTGTRSAVLHRGVHLRRARDKRRARGEKV